MKTTLFVPILFGGNLNIPQDLNITKSGYLVSAGRSGRDYELLCNAVKHLHLNVHIICDANHALKGIDIPKNVTLLRNCYGYEYIKELAEADLVLLILKDENISSGQMVLVTAMALGKVVIITKTDTTIEYGEHLKTCYFIKPNSIEDIRSAIEFCSKPSSTESIAQGAKQRYAERHSIVPYVDSLTYAILEIKRGGSG